LRGIEKLLAMLAAFFLTHIWLTASLSDVPHSHPQLTASFPLRVYFDKTFFLDPGTNVACWSSADKITFPLACGENSTCQCEVDDVITEAKQRVLNQTFDNVARYLNALVMVTDTSELIGELKSSDKADFPVPPLDGAPESHLYITLWPRPPGVPTLSFDFGVLTSESRPVQGGILFSVRDVPAQPQDFWSKDRVFFNRILREVFHLLGLSDLSWNSRWNSGIRNFTQYFPNATSPKVFRWLTAWPLNTTLSERLGDPDVIEEKEKVFGLEIDVNEDDTLTFGGDFLINRTHGFWHGRPFFTEIMTRDSDRLPYARISEVTMAALQATGWYEVNCSPDLCEQLEWGDYRSIVGFPKENLTNFLWGPPGEPGVWPTHYVDRTREEVLETFRCTFDHRSAGVSVRSTSPEGTWPLGETHCEGDVVTDGCGSPPSQFYDSTGLGFYGEKGVDYALVRYPYPPLYCQGGWPADLSPDYAHFGMKHGNNSFCAMSSLFDMGAPYPSYMPVCYEMGCDWYARLVVFVGQESRRCDRAGQRITFNDYQGDVICPDPNVICGILQYNRVPNATLHPKPPPPPPTATSVPTPSTELPSPAHGYSYLIEHTFTETVSWIFKRMTVTVTYIINGTYQDVLTNIDGLDQWTRQLVSSFAGTISVYEQVVSHMPISYVIEVPSIHYTGMYGVNGAGWVGIILAVIGLAAFIIAVFIFSRKADKAWQAGQDTIAARQRRMGDRRPRA
jgi:hypothetical protein